MIFFAEAAQQTRHEILRCADHGYFQAASRQAFEAIDFLFKGFPLCRHRARGSGELFAGFSQMHSFAYHFVQGHAHGIGRLAQLH